MVQRYDRLKAVQYARKWARGTNPQYGRMANDCTNFVSQVLYEGGWPMVGWGNPFTRASSSVWWFVDAINKGSYTWGGAANLHDFLCQSGRGVRVQRAQQLEVGDLLQYKDYTNSYAVHSMVVTDKICGDLLLSYHTGDTLDRPLSEILEVVPPELFVYWKINDVIPVPSSKAKTPVPYYGTPPTSYMSLGARI